MRTNCKPGQFTLRMLLLAVMSVVACTTASAQFQVVVDHPPGYVSSSESIRKTLDGGYISVGYHRNVGGLCEIILCKTNVLGGVTWFRALLELAATHVDEIPFAVREVVDQGESAGYIVAGTRRLASGLNEAIAIRTDAAGNQIWRNWYRENPTTNAVAYDIEPVYEPNKPVSFIMTGYIGADFSTGVSRSMKAFMMRLNAAGGVTWLRTWGYTYGSDPSKEERNVGFAVRQTFNPAGFVMTGYVNPTGKTGNRGILIVGTDMNGFGGFARTYIGPSNTFDDTYAIGKGISELPAGTGFIVTGPINTYTSSSMDIFLLRVDATGNTPTFRAYDLMPAFQSTEDYGFDIVLNGNGDYVVAGVQGAAPLGTGPGEWAMLMEVDQNTLIPNWAKSYGLRDLHGGWTFANTDLETGVTLDYIPLDGGYILEGDPQDINTGDGFYHIRTNTTGSTEDICDEEIPTRISEPPIIKASPASMANDYDFDDMNRDTPNRDWLDERCRLMKPAFPGRENDGEEGTSISAVPSPVPSGYSFRIVSEFKAGSPVEVTVVDILGRTIHTAKEIPSADGIRISTEGWAAGTYVVRLTTPDGTESQNLIVE